ncbi:MAG: metallophosphoesterase family protein [Nitritalea sp.]
MQDKSRRAWLKKAAWSGLGLSGLAASCSPAEEQRKAAEGFYFAHLTDMHVRRKRRGHEGYAACVAHINALQQAPELVLMGGDMAFDGNYTPKEEFIDQLQLVKGISDQLQMPYHPCIGNHDSLGLNPRRKVEVNDPDIGKGLFLDTFGLENSYYSFDHKGWHFVVLDALLEVEAEHGPSQTHAFGEQQLDWLRFDLGRNPRPTVIATHIGPFCNIGQYLADPNLPAMNHMVVQDGLAFRQICERHQVKAVLQGHSHIPEEYRFNGIWYITSPAVSASWWSGSWKGYGTGYTLLHARESGELSWETRYYDWEAQLEPEDSLERERTKERAAFEQEQERLKQEEIHAQK